MQHYCQFQSLSQLYLCREKDCYHQQLSCKQCFQSTHITYHKNTKQPHQSLAFDQSPHFQHILKLLKIQKIIQQKLNNTFQTFKTNHNYNAFATLTQSQLFLQIFGNDNSYVASYQIIRQLYYKRPIILYYPFKQGFCDKLKLIHESKISPYRQMLLQQSSQWLFLTNQFELMMGNNSAVLQNFLIIQQKYFSQYCQTLTKTQQTFSIQKYIDLRKKDQTLPLNQIYFSLQFEEFLKEKYQNNLQQQNIFEITEYINNFWLYFSSIVNESQFIQAYLEFQWNAYRNYSLLMKDSNINETLLGFRMWKSLYFNSNQLLSKIKNHYFYEIFILSYIDLCIKQKKINQVELKNWKQYLLYVRDFTQFSASVKKQPVMDINKYGSYFLFKRDNQKFVNHLQENAQTVFNRKLAISYLNEVYISQGMPSKKAYKAFLEEKQQQQIAKAKKFANDAQLLESKLKEEEKDKFYDNVFVNFISYCKQQNRPLTADQYYHYKNIILSQIDQKYIKLQNQKVKAQFQKLNLEQQAEGEQTQKSMMKESSENQQMTQMEYILAQRLKNQHSGSQEDQDQIQDALKLCLCCNGNPYDCQTQQCKLMGCCTACVLG